VKISFEMHADLADIWAIVVGAHHIFTGDMYGIVLIPCQEIIATFSQQMRYSLDHFWLC
jgi:hypothetical protein